MLSSHLTAVLLFAVTAHADAQLVVDTPMAPPAWALLERELLTANTRACEEFFARYFDDRGYLLCVERWGVERGGLHLPGRCRLLQHLRRGMPSLLADCRK